MNLSHYCRCDCACAFCTLAWVPVGFFKLCDLHGQLCLASVLLSWCTSVVWVALHALPCEGLFWVPSKLYFLQSSILWVFCMLLCFLHSGQCFASFWDLSRIWLLKETIFFLKEPPPVVPTLGPLHSFSVGQTFLMHSSALSILQTLCGKYCP